MNTSEPEKFYLGLAVMGLRQLQFALSNEANSWRNDKLPVKECAATSVVRIKKEIVRSRKIWGVKKAFANYLSDDYAINSQFTNKCTQCEIFLQDIEEQIIKPLDEFIKRSPSFIERISQRRYMEFQRQEMRPISEVFGCELKISEEITGKMATFLKECQDIEIPRYFDE